MAHRREGDGTGGLAAVPPAAPPPPQRRQQEEREHERSMASAFTKSQSALYAQWDLWAGISTSVLLLLALPSSMQRHHWRAQLVAFVAEIGMRVAPAYMACLASSFYLPRRTPIIVACRLASLLLPRLVVAQPPVPSQDWGGWPQFLLFTRALGINTLPWLARLPFKWFLAVHLIAVADAVRASVTYVCRFPAFTSPAAQQQFAAAVRAARMLTVLSATPGTAADDGLACQDGVCACRQMAAWLLVCIGFALPTACQYIAQAAAKQRFLRRHCRRPGCEACAPAKGVDLPLLCVSTAMLFAGFCAAAWQLVTAVLVPGSALAAAAGAASGQTCAGGTCAAGEL